MGHATERRRRPRHGIPSGGSNGRPTADKFHRRGIAILNSRSKKWNHLRRNGQRHQFRRRQRRVRNLERHAGNGSPSASHDFRPQVELSCRRLMGPTVQRRRRPRHWLPLASAEGQRTTQEFYHHGTLVLDSRT